MPVSFELTLLERLSDRVVVTISLCPGEEPAQLDGVVVELLSSRREPISPRLLLPVSGTLVGPLVTQAELRASAEIPPFSVVKGTAWSGEDKVEALCSADDSIGLGSHVRGVNPPLLRSHGILVRLLPEEREALARRLPWITRPEAPPRVVRQPLQVDGEEVPRADSELFEPDLTEMSEELHDYCQDLGLDEEDTEWLKELLSD